MVKELASEVVTADEEAPLSFRKSKLEDGKAIWQLIQEMGVLDLNSSYSYLMWSHYFDETSVVVESDQQIVGFISGFIQPNSPDTLFIWQVAVHASERGKGLASRMLRAIVEREVCKNICFVEATVTPSNKASQALFRKLARDLQTACRVTEGFREEQFPKEGHEAEELFIIGPF